MRICILWKISTGPFFVGQGYIWVRVCNGGGGAGDSWFCSLKIWIFWFVSTKQTKSDKVGGVHFTDLQRAIEATQYYDVIVEGQTLFTGCTFLPSVFSLGFNCHLFLWQCQYSMDQLTGKSSIFFIYMLYSRGTKKNHVLCIIITTIMIISLRYQTNIPPYLCWNFLKTCCLDDFILMTDD